MGRPMAVGSLGVETADDAMAMAARGADLVETMAVGELLGALEPRA